MSLTYRGSPPGVRERARRIIKRRLYHCVECHGNEMCADTKKCCDCGDMPFRKYPKSGVWVRNDQQLYKYSGRGFYFEVIA